MANLSIRGGERTVDDLFSDDYRFSIPDYQRQYSWTPIQAGELLDDLLFALDATEDGEPDPYFLGSVVLVKEEGVPSAQVVDGQQRLTTLAILFAALALRVSPELNNDVRKRLQQDADLVAGKPAVPRLTLRPRDAEFFAEFVQAKDGIDKLIELEPKAAGLTEPRQNIRANAKLFLDRLEEMGPEKCQRLVSFVATRCVLVAVSTPDLNSAYRIFAVLNERGLDLTPADIFKSVLIGEVESDLRPKYTELWENAEDELGREGFGDLFAHIRMIFGRQKARRSLLVEFREQVIDVVDDPKAMIDGVIIPYADVYAEVVTATYGSHEHQEPINRLLRWLNQLDNFDWIPPALVFLQQHHNDPAAVLRFLTALDRLASSMFIQRTGITRRVERYGRVLTAMEDDDALFAPGSPLHLGSKDCEDTRANLAGDLYRVARIPKYVLLRLDSAMAGEGASYDYPVISVEHVLPQTMGAKGQWPEHFTPEQHEAWVHRVGNLVLLSCRKNSAAKNYDFDVKKEKYFTGDDGSSPFVLTSKVVAEPTWTIEVLERRQEEAMGLLTKLWQLDQPAPDDG